MGCCGSKKSDPNKEGNTQTAQMAVPTPTPTANKSSSNKPPTDATTSQGRSAKDAPINIVDKGQPTNIETNTGQKLETKMETLNEEKKPNEEDKPDKEQKHLVATKGSESAYGKLRTRKESKKKALSSSNYNQQGLVDKRSKEFALVRDFLSKKNYNLIESIGTGNYAEVYKAFNITTNKLVAVKVIDLTKTGDNYRLGFLQREIAIISQLKHPGIIKHYEVDQTSNRIFMVMKFCSNGTVTDWLRDRGAFTEVMAWEMDTRILDGFHYMHNSRIAHRDLKLENILITDRCEPKISDFSYAVVVDENEINSTTFCGSIPYFAPEILQRKPHNPLPSDVWSLGVCFYVMVCDGLPFRIDDEKKMLAKQLDRDWDFKKRVRNKLSTEFKQMVRDMLEPDVDNRATTQQLINNTWIKNKPKADE